MHIIVEWAQTEVGAVTIVTGSYIWTECELVCACISIMYTGVKLRFVTSVWVHNQTLISMANLLLLHLMCSQARKRMSQLEL